MHCYSSIHLKIATEKEKKGWCQIQLLIFFFLLSLCHYNTVPFFLVIIVIQVVLQCSMTIRSFKIVIKHLKVINAVLDNEDTVVTE